MISEIYGDKLGVPLDSGAVLESVSDECRKVQPWNTDRRFLVSTSGNSEDPIVKQRRIESWVIPGIDVEFAAIVDQESLINFAEKYGFTGVGGAILEFEFAEGPVVCEHYQSILAEARVVASLIKLINLVHTGDLNGFRHLIETQKVNNFILWLWIQSTFSVEREFEYLRTGLLKALGASGVESIFEVRLNGVDIFCKMRQVYLGALQEQGPKHWRDVLLRHLSMWVNEDLAKYTVGGVVLGPTLRIEALATSPIGAAYSRIALRLTKQHETIRKCRVCGTTFIQEHARQEFCENKCRQKAYRQSKKEKESGEKKR